MAETTSGFRVSPKTGSPRPVIPEFGVEPIANQEFLRTFMYTIIVTSDEGQQLLPDMDLYTYAIELPEITWDPVELNVANARFTIPGRHAISTLHMSVYVVPKVSDQSKSNLDKVDSIYKLHNIQYELVSDRFKGKSFLVTCKLYNVDGTLAQTFLFHRVYLQSFRFTSLAWDSNEVLDMELTFFANKMFVQLKSS